MLGPQSLSRVGRSLQAEDSQSLPGLEGKVGFLFLRGGGEKVQLIRWWGFEWGEGFRRNRRNLG